MFVRIFFTDGTNEMLYSSSLIGSDGYYPHPSQSPSGIFGTPVHASVPYGCGYMRNDREGDLIVSTCDTVKVTFYSDHSVTDEGFLIRYTQGKHNCF